LLQKYTGVTEAQTPSMLISYGFPSITFPHWMQ
jgi:hypothetical protein